MATFQYNWATAEMVKLYLRNSRAQAKRKAKKAAGANADTTESAGVPGSVSIDTNAEINMGLGRRAENLEEDESDSDDSDDE